MRNLKTAIPIATVIMLLAAATPWAGTLSGTVKMGGIIVDETGDRSAVQETYDIYDGFALSRIQLMGTFDPHSAFTLDLRDLNLKSRAGDLTYRRPGRFKLRAGFDQNRYVFDPGRGVTADRKNWKLGMQYTPNRMIVLSGDLNRTTREGDRLGYPLGTVSAYGTGYDNAFTNARLAADFQKDRRGGGVSLELSDYSDDHNSIADRQGQVWAARLYSPLPFYDKWTNLFRASYGTRKLKDGDVEYKLSSFQYTAVVQPLEPYQLRYAFQASRVDDKAEDLQTDRIQNDFDATWFCRYGLVRAGYGYETNDDDRFLTSYQSWRAGAAMHLDRRVNARFDYAGRVKNDQEDLTLLKDIESSSIRGKLDVTPIDQITVGGDYAKRRRELTDIHVTVNGIEVGAFLRYEMPHWIALSADYSHAIDEYDDLLAPYNTVSDIVTGRAETTRIPHVTLASGLTYLDIGRDLDIEKSIVFVEGSVKFARQYHLDVKYNVYNYDDYILLDRYYTANVVRFDLGYDLRP